MADLGSLLFLAALLLAMFFPRIAAAIVLTASLFRCVLPLYPHAWTLSADIQS
jgi:hypothetical protein